MFFMLASIFFRIKSCFVLIETARIRSGSCVMYSILVPDVPVLLDSSLEVVSVFDRRQASNQVSFSSLLFALTMLSVSIFSEPSC